MSRASCPPDIASRIGIAVIFVMAVPVLMTLAIYTVIRRVISGWKGGRE